MARPQTPFPQPDRDAVATFVNCLFRYADGYVNLRAFHDLKDGAPPLFVEPVKIGAPDFIERVCERIREAAAHPEPHVFCPPLCTFTEPNGAATENLAEGVALSVECDTNPYAALKKLTGILGNPTAIVASGGAWKNEAGRLEAKLHLHWRQDAVETVALLVDLQHQTRQYVVLTESQILVAALWVIMAWVHSRAATHSPVLMATSPQPNSGKSTPYSASLDS
jgi:hypothetical protein